MYERLFAIQIGHMLALTHAAIATAGVSLILSTSNPIALGLAIIGSQLPDLDSTTSIIGQVCFPLSSWIEDRYPHRTVTHCLLTSAALAIASLITGIVLGEIRLCLALPLGHLLSCFSDTFTKQGVQLFWPEPVWCISVSNPRRRLRTGGSSELWILATATALLFLGIHLANDGGLTKTVGRSLALRDSAVKVYNDSASERQMIARITGVWASDRTRADGRYTIVDMSGSEFIVTDGSGVYKTNEQIIVDRLTVEPGEPATTTMQSLSFDDELATEMLQQLRTSAPQAAITLTGSVTVDYPDEIAISPDPRTFPTATLTGQTLKLSYLPLDQAIALMREQYVVGTLQARLVQTRP